MLTLKARVCKGHRLVFSLRRRTLVLLLFSHCATRSLPRHAGWLLRHLSPRRRRLILSSCCRTLVRPLSSHCAAFSSPHRFDGTGIGGIRGCVLAYQGPKVGLLLGLTVCRERCRVRRAARQQDVVGLAASHALHSSGSNVHGVVCKQRILVSSILGRLFQLSKILRQD
jgi:hypothetical protein